MKKFIITEEEKKRILSLYEQEVTTTTTTLPYFGPLDNDKNYQENMSKFNEFLKKRPLGGNTKNPKMDVEMTHKVVAGDTLDSIAKKYGVTIDDIKKENPGITDEQLKPGNEICFNVSYKGMSINNKPKEESGVNKNVPPPPPNVKF